MTHDVVDRIGERIDPWDSPEQRIAEQQVERRLWFLRWSVPVLLTVALAVAGYRGLDTGSFDPRTLSVNGQVGAVDPDESWIEVTSFARELLTDVSRVHTVQTGEARTMRWYWLVSANAMPHSFVAVTIDEPCLDQRAYITEDWSEEHPLPVRTQELALGDAPMAWLVLEATTTDTCLSPRRGDARVPTIIGLPHPEVTYRPTRLPLTRSVTTAPLEDAELVNLTDDLEAVRECLRRPEGPCSSGSWNARR